MDHQFHPVASGSNISTNSTIQAQQRIVQLRRELELLEAETILSRDNYTIPFDTTTNQPIQQNWQNAFLHDPIHHSTYLNHDLSAPEQASWSIDSPASITSSQSELGRWQSQVFISNSPVALPQPPLPLPPPTAPIEDIAWHLFPSAFTTVPTEPALPLSFPYHLNQTSSTGTQSPRSTISSPIGSTPLSTELARKSSIRKGSKIEDSNLDFEEEGVEEGNPTGGPVDPNDKRRRNTEASARFRAKKKATDARLAESTFDLRATVEALEEKKIKLTAENAWLRGLISAAV